MNTTLPFLFLLALAFSVSSNTRAAGKQPVAEAPDYDNDSAWLCRPGRDDYCAVDQSATQINSDGKMIEVAFTGATENPPVDCFYVYPTVSIDPSGNSDLTPNREEAGVILNQAARFSSVCRVFAPLYRQVTLTALRARIQGQDMKADWTMGYGDVLRAWNHYLDNDNNGRGVVLIGHSQGSGVLNNLIKQEIDGKPLQKQIVSAMLTGSNTAVPVGKVVGRDFKHMPLCEQQGQTECVISFVTFRNDVPPPPNSRFGRVRGHEDDPSQQAACTNPAELDGSGGVLIPYLGAADSGFAVETKAGEWVKGKPTPTTPFVTLPGLLTAECVYERGFSYLSVTTHAIADDPRTDSIPGDVYTEGQRLDDWGLHLIDMNIAMGNLVNIVRQQGYSWISR